jgi:WD40 repeat protein
VWDVRTGEKLLDLGAEFGDCYWAVAASHDGRYALTDRRLWDLKTGKLLRTLQGDLDGELWGAAFSPDASHAVLGGERRTANDRGTLWVGDVETGKLVRRLGNGESVRTVAYAPDGTRIAAGHFKTSGHVPGNVRVYEAATGAVLHDFEVPTGATCVRFSRNGKQLLSANHRSVRLWDLETGTQVQHLEGHTAAIEWADFTPDGRHIVSVGATGDPTVRVWDAASGKEQYCFKNHVLGVLGVDVSPDGRYALSGGRDGTLRLWRLPSPADAL